MAEFDLPTRGDSKSPSRYIYIVRIQTAIIDGWEVTSKCKAHLNYTPTPGPSASLMHLGSFSSPGDDHIAHVDRPMDDNTFWQQLRATSVKALGSKLQCCLHPSLGQWSTRISRA